MSWLEITQNMLNSLWLKSIAETHTRLIEQECCKKVQFKEGARWPGTYCVELDTEPLFAQKKKKESDFSGLLIYGTSAIWGKGNT